MLSLLITLSLVFATPDDTLGTAEVTATRRIETLSSPTSIQRISQNDVTERGITDIGDAMRRFSGVNLRDYGGAGGLKTVSVRGMGASHTVVTYDGLPVSDTRQGQIDMGQFNVDRLSTIELQTLDNEALLCPVRSIAAAVISLNGLSNHHADRKWHGSTSVKQASFSTYAPSLMIEKQLTQRAAFCLSQDYFYALNNYPFTIENGVATMHLRRNNSKMQTATSEASMRITPNDKGEINVKAYFSHNYRHLPGMVRYYVNQNNERLNDQTAFAQVFLKQQLPHVKLFAAAKYNWQKSLYDNIDAQYPDGALRQHYWQRESYATAGASTNLCRVLQLSYATDYAYASLNSNQTTDHRASRHTWLQALSLQLRSERFTLIARAIYHHVWNQTEGGGSAKDCSRITPSVTASVRLLSNPLWLYLRAGYKESFRAPTFTESYYYHLGSKTLNPELARQFSIGTTLQASPAQRWPLLALTIDGYYNRVSDKIVSIPYNLFIWQTVNMGKVRTLGTDLTLQSKWHIATHHALSLSLNYSLQQSCDYTSPTLTTWHKQLAYTPIHSGGGSATWHNPWANLVMHATFASMRWCTNNHIATTDLPAYSEWGVSLFRNIGIGQSMLTARIDLINLFDKRYEVIGKYPMPGRAYKITLNYSF